MQVFINQPVTNVSFPISGSIQEISSYHAMALDSLTILENDWMRNNLRKFSMQGFRDLYSKIT